MDILILVCVGASEFPFDRILKMLDELCDEKVINGTEILAQTGVSNYKPRNYKSFSLIGREEFQKYMKDADIVITHAGTGSVLPPLKEGKKIIVVPRKAEMGEHIDNHQDELAEIFTNSGYTMCANNKEELKSCLIRSEKFQPKKFVSNNMNMCNIIQAFIEMI